MMCNFGFIRPAMKIILVALIFIPTSALVAAESRIIRPFESYDNCQPINEIDKIVMAGLKTKGIKPANLCSNEVFIRRVYLDINGTLPNANNVRAFVRKTNPDKRAELIDKLLKNEEFADYWSLKWCDLLRVKAEFPINLWPNAVQAYHRWLHDAIRNNMPYDKFVREILTSSGSNFRVPQVNFYRAIQGQKPSAISTAVALTFMGTRLGSWPEEKRDEMEVFFSRLAYKETEEWKEEIVYCNPSITEAVDAVFPDGAKVHIEPNQDRRKVFADWLIAGENPWFARNIVNRIWSWLLGRGIIHEPDDIRKDNPAVYPELLEYLEKELVKSNYDLQHIYRLILNSRTYQQSSIVQSDNPDAEKLFACYLVRQLEAEVLADAICKITGSTEFYSSVIPEPFTFIPKHNRSIELADGSITSQFLEMFGRPSRDTGLESERNNQPTNAQRLHLLNSSHVQKKIERSNRLKKMLKMAKHNRKKLIRMAYMEIISRNPTQEEIDSILNYSKIKDINSWQAACDLIWALVNSKEFLYRH